LKNNCFDRLERATCKAQPSGRPSIELATIEGLEVEDLGDVVDEGGEVATNVEDEVANAIGEVGTNVGDDTATIVEGDSLNDVDSAEASSASRSRLTASTSRVTKTSSGSVWPEINFVNSDFQNVYYFGKKHIFMIWVKVLNNVVSMKYRKSQFLF
jgi:hypothetical protein